MDVNEERGFSVGGSVGEENYFLGYTFTDRSHSSRVVKSIMDLSLEDGLFADVTVTVDGKEFHLHRLVLSAQSSFFRSMFTSNLKESYNRSIELKDVSASVFQLLIGYIYHGTIKLRVEELQDTYEMADMYNLTSLFEECSRFLSRTVEVKNCLQVILSRLIRLDIFFRDHNLRIKSFNGGGFFFVMFRYCGWQTDTVTRSCTLQPSTVPRSTWRSSIRQKNSSIFRSVCYWTSLKVLVLTVQPLWALDIMVWIEAYWIHSK